MNIILVSDKHSSSRTLSISGRGIMLLAVALFALVASASAMFGYVLGGGRAQHAAEQAALVGRLESQQQEIVAAREAAEREVDALTVRIAELQARLLRLDALGERLARMADLDPDEFDFGQVPPQGGPEVLELEEDFTPPSFMQTLDQLTIDIEHRAQQLEAIGKLMGRRDLLKDVFVTGVPVEKGWLSSRYGRRTDPIRGKIAWHGGLDFAGKPGTPIIAVAAGVVTYSSERYGYGRLVEINHGNGYSTRYAHNRENLVEVGEIVEKGQVIALMGSSGRSTGPHVHFEVHRDGKPVNPAGYISRASH